MPDLTRRRALAATALTFGATAVRADPVRLRVSYGYSIGYLPLMVMRTRGLIEAEAARLGLGPVQTEWRIADGGNNINDAMLAGALDIAGIGIPGYLVLRDRTLGKRQAMTAISAIQSGALWLNTVDPRIRSLADYTADDRIAVPGIKTSFAAVALQMAAAKAFGIDNYAKLDPLTVGLAHPDAYAAMMSGKAQITSHFASPPFSYQELRNPAVHRVLSTSDVSGPLTILVAMTPLAFADANPGLIQAFLAAQEAANVLIAADPDAAVTAYGSASGLSVPRDDLLEIMRDPENSYGVAPAGSLVYATFLARTGVLKANPAAWTDLFLPAVHGRQGS
jgi:NitT/TauT family transport system substrate-binding protein